MIFCITTRPRYSLSQTCLKGRYHPTVTANYRKQNRSARNLAEHRERVLHKDLCPSQVFQANTGKDNDVRRIKETEMAIKHAQECTASFECRAEMTMVLLSLNQSQQMVCLLNTVRVRCEHQAYSSFMSQYVTLFQY